MLAIVCLHIYPNIPSILPELYQDWYNALYAAERNTLQNSLWIHYVTYDIKYEKEFFLPVLQKTFTTFWDVNIIGMVVPPGQIKKKLNWLEKYALKITSSIRSQAIFLIKRTSCMNKYNVRRAVEEDNDDLIPLIESETSSLTEIYGDYYVAELLTRHPESKRQIIVAEYDNKTVGILCLNNTVNCKLLHKHFELSTYKHLLKKREKSEDEKSSDERSDEEDL